MINEKYNKYISIVSIMLAIIFVFSSLFFGGGEKTTVTSKESVDEVINKDEIMEISIEMNESDWNWLLENATKEEYKMGNITINGETFYNVGIRPKGNSSLRQVASNSESDRYSLKIDFGEYVDGQTYHGIEKLALNNMISDATYMKEYISYDIYDFLGVSVPEYSYANINVNGEGVGLFLAVEVIDERYLEKNYGDSTGNLYKPEPNEIGGLDKAGAMERPAGNRQEGLKGNNMDMPPNTQPPNEDLKNPNANFNGDMKNLPNNLNQDATTGASKTEAEGEIGEGKNQGGMMGMGGKNSSGANLKYIDDNIESYSVIRESAVFKSTTDEDFLKVIDMIKSLNEGKDIEKYLNVEEVLKYFAVNTFLVNLDSYSGGMYHNYYLYERDGVCEILPWDLNMSFGGFTVNSGSKAVNFPIDNPVTGSLENAPLIGKLLEVDEYKELYHSYLEKLSKEYFESGVFENTVIKLDKLIGSYVKNDKTAFYTYEEYKNSIPELLTFGKDRTTSVNAQLDGSQPSTEYGNVETTLNMQALGSQIGGAKGDKQNAIQKGDKGAIPNGIEAVNGRENPMAQGNIKNLQEVSGMGKQLALQVIPIILVLIGGIVFVVKFKRKND